MSTLFPVYHPETGRRCVPLNTPVHLVWGPWHGTGVLLGPPHRRDLQWATPSADKRSFSDLPPRQVKRYADKALGELRPTTAAQLEAAGWGDDPTAFRPLDPDTWRHPLPPPLHMTAAHANGVAVRIDHMAFTVAEAAAEMEAEREFRRGRTDEDLEASRQGQKPELPWWRDVWEVRFSPPGGAIDRLEVEGRVMRTMYFYGHGGLRLPTQRTNAAVLADMKSSSWQAPDVPPLTRGQAETDERICEVIGWLAEMHAEAGGGRRLHVLSARARDVPRSWVSLADELQISVTRVHQIHDGALDRLLAIANAGTPLRAAARLDSLHRSRHARLAADV